MKIRESNAKFYGNSEVTILGGGGGFVEIAVVVVALCKSPIDDFTELPIRYPTAAAGSLGAENFFHGTNRIISKNN